MSNKNSTFYAEPKKLSSAHAGPKMGRRFFKGTLATIAAGVMLASGLAVPANAALSQTGPVDPAHGFPSWFTDQNGLTLELCFEGALCLAALPDPNQPLDFPTNFPDEVFWWAADANIEVVTGTGTVNASLTMAQEAAFTNGVAEAGQQNAFSRIRIRIDGLTPGASYLVTHPYGSITLVANPSGVINYTNDFGCFDTPCSQTNFDRALNGPVTGPFLVWTEGAPVGYIGDPEVEHAVTGSPTGNNFFRVEGENVGGMGVGVIQTDLFSVQGKIAGVDAPTPPAPVDEAPDDGVPEDDAPDAPDTPDLPEEDPVEEPPAEEVPAPVEEVPVDEAAEEAAEAQAEAAEEAAELAEEQAEAEAEAAEEAAELAEEQAEAEAEAAEEAAKAQAKAAEDAAKAEAKAAEDAAELAEEEAEADAEVDAEVDADADVEVETEGV